MVDGWLAAAFKGPARKAIPDHSAGDGAEQSFVISLFRERVCGFQDHDNREQDPVAMPEREKFRNDIAKQRSNTYAERMPEYVGV